MNQNILTGFLHRSHMQACTHTHPHTLFREEDIFGPHLFLK